jgi:hypothetical protein
MTAVYRCNDCKRWVEIVKADDETLRTRMHQRGAKFCVGSNVAVQPAAVTTVHTPAAMEMGR